MRPNAILTVDAESLSSVAVAGGNYTVLISGEQTAGTYAVIEMKVPPQGGPGPHAHAAIQETFYVLEGEVVFKSETQTYTAKPGSVITIPKGGAIHAFKNQTAQIVRLLCLVNPAGLDKFFQEIGQPVPANTFLPPAKMTDADLKYLQEIAQKYDQELFPPDYLDR
ncbi:cupin domain-containing protein [Adhaeribacter swui]|uniref:Cupin domain-containing protein n=1 Tax=Adhaeribacter swui TaxID=2086471 RepID=A0A7G7G430_9BACT|nr:cupin domain-containing protein [Adhaeribacter swui]QNF31914.1 cupin domain-containing protein [Adhaeribacter swui]